MFTGIPHGPLADAPFIITLMTRVAILPCKVGLNIALGIGGLISFGHAAFGIKSYIMILAFRAQTFTRL